MLVDVAGKYKASTGKFWLNWPIKTFITSNAHCLGTPVNRHQFRASLLACEWNNVREVQVVWKWRAQFKEAISKLRLHIANELDEEGVIQANQICYANVSIMVTSHFYFRVFAIILVFVFHDGRCLLPVHLVLLLTYYLYTNTSKITHMFMFHCCKGALSSVEWHLGERIEVTAALFPAQMVSVLFFASW